MIITPLDIDLSATCSKKAFSLSPNCTRPLCSLIHFYSRIHICVNAMSSFLPPFCLAAWPCLPAPPPQTPSRCTGLSAQTWSCWQRQAADAWTPAVALFATKRIKGREEIHWRESINSFEPCKEHVLMWSVWPKQGLLLRCVGNTLIDFYHWLTTALLKQSMDFWMPPTACTHTSPRLLWIEV